MYLLQDMIHVKSMWNVSKITAVIKQILQVLSLRKTLHLQLKRNS